MPTRQLASAPPKPATAQRTPARTLRLTEVRVGARARMHSHELPDSDLQLLEAIGLTARSEIRVLQQGEPCIVLVRDTRVGLTRPVASRMRVVPLEVSLDWALDAELDAPLDAS